VILTVTQKENGILIRTMYNIIIFTCILGVFLLG
jgi:hypothetical protein